MLIVQKFGGSSLADPLRIRLAAQKLIKTAQEGHQTVAVVSAQGDTTDHLLSAIADITSAPSRRELDAYLSAGELLSAALMAMTIEKCGHRAISLAGWQAGLLTDSVHGNARVLGLQNDRIRKELEQGNIVVIAGFQGIDAAGNVTTLGRGGSDTTAVALAAFLGADRCLIYTDVDGIYDRDPRIFPDAVRFDAIDYTSMLRLAKNGAQVLHDRAVELAQEKGVEIQVLSSFRPGPGTMVGSY
ncbi:MAG: aspartate kinase [Ruminococcaceae bacterium]|nr:aspartate kinase [Oscillospiraceae bacterium]